MDKKELIELLGLTCWHDLKGWTEYPLMLDEREDYHGKQLEYLDIKPSDYEEGKINVISGSMGLGKSYCFKKRLTGKTLLISPRKSNVKDYVREANIPFEYYLKQNDKPRPTRELIEADNLAITELSCHRIMSEEVIPKYKNIIWEEIALSLDQLSGDTSRTPFENHKALSSLLQRAENVYCLGWLIRDHHFEYLKEISGKDINFEKWVKPIAQNIELIRYRNKEQFFEKLNELAKTKRVQVFTDRKRDCLNIQDNISVDSDFFTSDKPIPQDLAYALADKEQQGMTKQVEIYNPFISHGYNIRNETDYTAMLWLNNTKQSMMTVEDKLQMMFRNRDAKHIIQYSYTPEGQNDEKSLRQIATRPAQFRGDQNRTFGIWNEKTHRKEIDNEHPIIKLRKGSTNVALIEKVACRSTESLYLGWLGAKEENITDITDERKPAMLGLNEKDWQKNTLEYGRLLSEYEWEAGTHDERKYTQICKDLGVKELDEKQIKRWDNGRYKENLIRQKRMFDELIVKSAQIQRQGLFSANERFGALQYQIRRIMEEQEYMLTQNDFKYSDFWIKALHNEKVFNRIMRDEHLPELCITSDDKAKPLLWLKRYLTRHNFDCEIKKTSKTKQKEIRKLAEKSCRAEYNLWKQAQKQMPKEERYRELENQRIEHYLAWLVKEGRYKDLTEEMKALRNVYDEWNMTIKTYED